MEPGEKCICQTPDWFNAYGSKYTKLIVGERLTVRETKNIAGSQFLSFEEHDKDQFFLFSGFKPLRSLN